MKGEEDNEEKNSFCEKQDISRNDLECDENDTKQSMYSTRIWG